jgi:hypothetical protein
MASRSGINEEELSPRYRKVLKEQDRFLELYEKSRAKGTSAKGVGVVRETVRLWEKKDILGFKKRLEEADEKFCDTLEQKALALIDDMSVTNSPLLLITLLNANLPNKYRPNVIVPDETAKDMLQELRKLSKGQKDKVKEDTADEQSPLEQAEQALNIRMSQN